MTGIIERDALANTPDAPANTSSHVPEEVKSFIATPRMDQPLLQKMLGWVRGDLPPGAPIVHKSADGLRYMFLITSNAYQDREGETITSAALKAYEGSCYIGEDLYNNDNPLLWWHDDEVPIGTIEAVEYVEPFLIEIAKEINDPIARIVWDYAEKNGDQAGTSHRFGYLEKDRDPDGTFHRIFKQETTFLPERQLAANDRTYAGVLKPMTIPESRKRLGKIIEEATGLKDLAGLIETDITAARKRLTDMGLQHKAAKPPAVPPVEADATGAADTADETKATPAADMGAQMQVINQIYALVMDLVDSQLALADGQASMAKAHKEAEDARSTERTAQKTYTASLENQVKTLAQSVAILEKRLNLAPRSVQTQPGETAEAVKSAVDQAQKAREDDAFEEVPGFGKLKPPPKY